ncbi:hypothetical protein BEN47_08755 [Hymenobacter lapidarius]|uniref:Antitoxin n=1 Tax=Hymenobacter lapidarius TaxID=1908237 RepID=A0A1G1TC27_9BACT|nr:DUF433 domain-containing protein [Hymenobacter lapidarius]OGX88424.1 hypothetical protein BEN47_08755 [Hymenobacter lapidarius]
MHTSPNHPHIGSDPEIRFGRACLIGTRISVDDVLGWLGNGMSNADIIEDFPELDEQLIRACLRYAADRQRHTRIVAR